MNHSKVIDKSVNAIIAATHCTRRQAVRIESVMAAEYGTLTGLSAAAFARIARRVHAGGGAVAPTALPHPIGMNFGIRPQVFAVAALLAATRDFDVDLAIMAEADLRMTALYLAKGGGILLQVQRTWMSAAPCLHLAVVEHRVTGEPVVYEWSASRTEVPPTVVPDDAKPKVFKSNVGVVASYVKSRVRRFLQRKGQEV